MSWNDDSWRDGYDAWKLVLPDDEYDEDPCDHEDYDIDILTGRCSCYRCNESWYATSEEIDIQIKHEAEYYEHMESENRRQWWRNLWASIRSIVPRRRRKIVLDDDIPF